MKWNTNHFSEFCLKILFCYLVFLFSSFFHVLFINEPNVPLCVDEAVDCLSTWLSENFVFGHRVSMWVKADVFKVTVSFSDYSASSVIARGPSLFQYKTVGFLLFHCLFPPWFSSSKIWDSCFRWCHPPPLCLRSPTDCFVIHPFLDDFHYLNSWSLS